MTHKFIRLLVVLLLQLVLPVHGVSADTGPKPTMDFEFTQDTAGEALIITSGILYECDQSDCSDAAPLQEAGPQRFTCEANTCHALAYGFSQYHKLEIEFSDGKTRQSNIFQTAGFNSQYKVTVRPEDLLVEARFSLGVFPPIITIALMCLCALVVVLLIVVLIIFLVRRSRKT
jgi:hypothetical protein